MNTQVSPPAWAEGLLRVVVGAQACDHVSGDLLEQYRVSVAPTRGQRRADRWYVIQVFGFVWRGARLWALLFAGAFIARTALDWLVPTTDFHTRAAVTTYLAASIVFAASFWPAWRSGAPAAGPLFGVATVALAAPISIAGAVALLILRHDPATLDAIRAGGDLDEVFSLPFLVIVPAIVVGTIAGLLGAALGRVRRSLRA
jgi:hypothetical protein